MGELAEAFAELRERKMKLRRAFGVPCPQCNVKEPKRQPSILLPQQKCKVDGYVDPRPQLSAKQKAAALAPAPTTTTFLKG